MGESRTLCWRERGGGAAWGWPAVTGVGGQIAKRTNVAGLHRLVGVAQIWTEADRHQPQPSLTPIDRIAAAAAPHPDRRKFGSTFTKTAGVGGGASQAIGRRSRLTLTAWLAACCERKQWWRRLGGIDWGHIERSASSRCKDVGVVQQGGGHLVPFSMSLLYCPVPINTCCLATATDVVGSFRPSAKWAAAESRPAGGGWEGGGEGGQRV